MIRIHFQLLRLAMVFAVSTALIVGTGCAGQRHSVDAVPGSTGQAGDEDHLDWHDASRLTMEGRGWAETSAPYRRLPARAEGLVPPQVWSLARHTAGIAVRFVSDSPRIAARWDGGSAMYHMAATGNSGLDLYVRDGDGWRFRAVGKPDAQTTTRVLVADGPAAPTEYLLYLPLYHEVTELSIGVEPGASLQPAAARPESRRRLMVFYGTSITQGGCACRAGMCHVAILGRWFDREVINLGFSGAGKMDPAMADLLTELDAAVYVLECLPNMTTAMVQTRVAPFVRTLRQRRPATPIVLVESPFSPETSPGTAALRQVYATLVADGVTGLHLLPGAGQLDGLENGTVDGVHPTDLGFLRMARAYRPCLERILGPAIGLGQGSQVQELVSR